MTVFIEDYVPVVKYHGLNTAKDVDVSGNVTISGNLTVSGTTTDSGNALDLTNTDTTGFGLRFTGSGIYTGTGQVVFQNAALTSGVLLDFGTTAGLTTGQAVKIGHTTGAIADTGSLLRITSSSVDTGGATNGTLVDVKSTGQLAGTIERHDNILTTGTGISVIGTGIMTTTGNLVTLTANSATTAAGILRINANGLTDGIGLIIASSATAGTSTGRLLKIDHTGATTTSGIIAEVTSAATDETVVFKATGSGAITGVVSQASGTATVSGIVHESRATAATLTTGRYYSAHDVAGEVFGIGANGHIHSTVGAVAPTIAVTTQNGITAAAITAGGSDTCGVITTTGTSTNATVLDVTFNKTYTVAPKFVSLTPANASASMPNTNYFVSTIIATGFTITVPAAGTYAATPSWRYLVVA